MDYPHLIECTTLRDTQRCYMLNIGMREEELTEEEKRVLRETERYEMRKLEERLRTIKLDLERLRDIDGLPDEAVEILKRWTYRPEDYEDDDWDED